MCGKGNNGGDGLVAARQLAGEGTRVPVVLLAERGELKGEPAKNLAKFVSAGATASIRGVADAEIEPLLANADVILDAVYGTGSGRRCDVLSELVRQRLLREGSRWWRSICRAAGTRTRGRRRRGVSRRCGSDVHGAEAGACVRRPDGGCRSIVVAGIGSPEEAIVREAELELGGRGEGASSRRRGDGMATRGSTGTCW